MENTDQDRRAQEKRDAELKAKRDAEAKRADEAQRTQAQRQQEQGDRRVTEDHRKDVPEDERLSGLSAEEVKRRRDAANPPMPFDTRTDEERERGAPIPQPAGNQTPGATKSGDRDRKADQK
jgi:hypothetical protein